MAKNEINTLRDGHSTRNFMLWLSNEKDVYDAIVRCGQELAADGRAWDWETAELVTIGLFGHETPDGARAERVNFDQIAELFTEWM